MIKRETAQENFNNSIVLNNLSARRMVFEIQQLAIIQTKSLPVNPFVATSDKAIINLNDDTT